MAIYKIKLNGVEHDIAAVASTTVYTNATSGLTATTVQGAIDELAATVSEHTQSIQEINDTLTFDVEPVEDSKHLITSGAIWKALQGGEVDAAFGELDVLGDAEIQGGLNVVSGLNVGGVLAAEKSFTLNGAVFTFADGVVTITCDGKSAKITLA